MKTVDLRSVKAWFLKTIRSCLGTLIKTPEFSFAIGRYRCRTLNSELD